MTAIHGDDENNLIIARHALIECIYVVASVSAFSVKAFICAFGARVRIQVSEINNLIPFLGDKIGNAVTVPIGSARKTKYQFHSISLSLFSDPKFNPSWKAIQIAC